MTGSRWRSMALVVAFVLAPGLPAVPAGAAPATVRTETAQVGGRAYALRLPAGWDGGRAIPLVVLLHGYGSDGAGIEDYFKLGAVADREPFLLALPDGTTDQSGRRFWNATDACCDFAHRGVDDSAFLDGLITDVSRRHPVDARRIFAVGHSNGGFMSHRLACDHAGRIAAVVTLAGVQWKDQTRCPAGSPVSVLHVHGTADTSIFYGGGVTPGGVYPGARETVADWATKDGCTGALADTGRHLHLVAGTGDETSVARYAGCPAGVDVELWTINGGTHVPPFTSAWAESVWSFLAAHPKP